MKTLGISFLVGAAFLSFAGVAQADVVELRLDPSGAPACFTLDGKKAPISSCYVATRDPSGASMCFTNSGQKAPLALCQHEAPVSHVVRADPSGAPMCFTADGQKAPLSACNVQATPPQVVAIVDPL